MAKEFIQVQLSEQISKHSDGAEKLLIGEDRMERFLERLEHKLKKIPVVGGKLSYIPILASLVRAYVWKDYQDIPLGSIIAIVSAFIYFVAPFDLLLDSIPALGYIDDAAVLAFIWKMTESDVKEYKNWQEKCGKKVIGN